MNILHLYQIYHFEYVLIHNWDIVSSMHPEKGYFYVRKIMEMMEVGT